MGKDIEWIDIVRTAYEEFDVFPKGTVAQLEAENQRLRERNSQSTYCAYCGEDFPLDTEHTTLQVGIHIWECEKHPHNILCEAIYERCKDLDYEAQEYLATGKENDLALSTGIYKALDRIREVISDGKRHCKEMKDEIDALKEGE